MFFNLESFSLTNINCLQNNSQTNCTDIHFPFDSFVFHISMGAIELNQIPADTVVVILESREWRLLFRRLNQIQEWKTILTKYDWTIAWQTETSFIFFFFFSIFRKIVFLNCLLGGHWIFQNMYTSFSINFGKWQLENLLTFQ